ncbi:MAG: hypothetical protein Q9165_001997 [Trypethelium subeluteriae]
MDATARLPPVIANFLCNHERSLSETAQLCHEARHGQGGSSENQTLDNVFQDSLQLKSKLNELENSAGHLSGWALLASLINCEYQLYTTNKVPLRYNPWLSHWVEVVQSWQSASRPSEARSKQSVPVPTVQSALRTRVEFVKTLLLSDSAEALGQDSPSQIFHNVGNSPKQNFNIDGYIRMLEEEGIYEPKNSTKTTPGNGELETATARQNKHAIGEDLQYELKQNPTAALDRLRTLPVNLQSLELINSLLFSGVLDNYDPPGLMQDCIQHALRYIEHIGIDDADAEGQGPVTSTNGRKEDQSRAIKLLILFVRNLLTQNVINPQTSYFEIQEICVRFIWVKEVREFRSDLEAGVW